MGAYPERSHHCVPTGRQSDHIPDKAASMHRTIEYLRRQSKKSLLLLCLSLVVIIGICDYLVGPEIGFALFYLIPISLSSWFAGMSAGVILSVASAMTWFANKWLEGEEAFQHLPSAWNAVVQLGFFLVIVFLQRALQQEQVIARRDPLTGIGNRRFFFEHAETELHRAKRYPHPLTVAYMDLDNFKAVNDQFGHDVGDALLCMVTKIINQNIRSTDAVARLGGDEFALLLPETDAVSASRVVDKLHGRLLSAMQKNKRPVTFSIGVVTFLTQPESVDEMIKLVDDLMYSAKDSGKNQVKYEVYEKSGQ
jgi:diguanylate cyclase (GGDEF)-like protein